MRRILVFTGSRANTQHTLNNVSTRASFAELTTVVSGAAILDRYGNVEKLMEQDEYQ